MPRPNRAPQAAAKHRPLSGKAGQLRRLGKGHVLHRPDGSGVYSRLRSGRQRPQRALIPRQMPGLTGKISSSCLNSRAILELWNFRTPIRVYTRVSKERPFERFNRPFCARTRKRTAGIFPTAVSSPAGIRSSQNFYRLRRSPCRLESPRIHLDRGLVITGSKHDR